MASNEAQALHATDRVRKLDNGQTNAQGPCFRCGKLGHLANDCWCKEMDCNNCGGKSHVAWTCWNKRSKDKGSKTANKRDIHKIQKGNVCTVEYGDDQVTVRISKVDDSSDGFWVRCKLEGNSVKMQRDTRSRASLVSCDVHKKFLMHLPLRPSDTVFKGYTGQRVPMRGMTEVFNAMTKLLSCLCMLPIITFLL